MTNFTPGAAAAGGAVLGLAAALLYLVNGRIAGISGIVGGLVTPASSERSWRLAFLAGLVGGGAALALWQPSLLGAAVVTSKPALVVAGVLVGVGARLGAGCTSGHGLCGIPRLSRRSIVATLTFMATGMLTVLAVRLLGGLS